MIVAGDTNTTDRTEAHAILRSELDDAWHEAGFGFGGTFPGSDGPGSSRPRVFGVAVPRWLVRIDVVMHSPELVATSARTARGDGGSDHRGVIARLALRR